MTNYTRTRIVKIGNSQGVRIPKLLLEQANLAGEVELEVRDGEIVIRSSRTLREGWAEQFQRMAAHGDDKLLDGDQTTSAWDDAEWEWS